MEWRAAASYGTGIAGFLAVVGTGAAVVVLLTAPRGEVAPQKPAAFLVDAAALPPAAPPDAGRVTAAAVPVPSVPEAGPAEPAPVALAPPVAAPAPVRVGPPVRLEPPTERRDSARPSSDRAALEPPVPERRRPRPVPAPEPPMAAAPAQPMITPTEIRRIRAALRLTPEQAMLWPPVEAALTEVGAEQQTLVRSGRSAADAFSAGTKMKIYFAAQPLLNTLREDQKAQIRARARALGFEQIASYL